MFKGWNRNRGILYSYLFKAIDAFILILDEILLLRKILLETAKVIVVTTYS